MSTIQSFHSPHTPTKMSLKLCLIFLLSLSSVSFCISPIPNYVYASPRGNDSLDCGQPQTPCETLQYIFSDIVGNSSQSERNFSIVLFPGIYNVFGTVINSPNITIEPVSAGLVVFDCTPPLLNNSGQSEESSDFCITILQPLVSISQVNITGNIGSSGGLIHINTNTQKSVWFHEVSFINISSLENSQEGRALISVKNSSFSLQDSLLSSINDKEATILSSLDSTILCQNVTFFRCTTRSIVNFTIISSTHQFTGKSFLNRFSFFSPSFLTLFLVKKLESQTCNTACRRSRCFSLTNYPIPPV